MYILSRVALSRVGDVMRRFPTAAPSVPKGETRTERHFTSSFLRNIFCINLYLINLPYETYAIYVFWGQTGAIQVC